MLVMKNTKKKIITFFFLGVCMDGRNDLAIIKRVNYVLGMGRASVKRLLCCGGGDIYLYRVVVMLFTAFMRLQIYTTIVHE